MGNRQVAVLGCANYDQVKVTQRVERLLSSLDLPDLSGKRVLIKPNILIDAHPRRAVTTHPSVVAAAADYVIKAGGTPVIGDSPSIQRSGFVPKSCGIQAVCDELKVPWVDFTAKSVRIPVPNGVKQKSFTVTEEATSADLIINLAKLKTHQLMYMTGAVKNIFGLISSVSKSPYHLKFSDRMDFADMLIDLNDAVTPAVHLIDGIIGMEGEGPSNGRPVKTGVLIASRDPYLADLAGLEVMGEDPHAVPVMKRALQRGKIEDLDITHVEMIFEDVRSFRSPGFQLVPKSGKKGFSSIVLSHLRRLLPAQPHPDPAPFINQEKCITCMACYQICPADAIIKEQKPVRLTVDERICIRCYCCHEVCPVGAISIGRP
jgi:uncharacterized protein (DUF362 family)/ferredoxin